MQPRITLRLTMLLVVVAALFANCKKGDAGPEGPEGPAGPQGPPGPTGTANVIYSTWQDVTYSEHEENGQLLGYFSEWAVDKLSNAILNSGDVRVYFNFGTTADPDIVLFPLSDNFFNTHVSVDLFPQTILLYSNFNASTFTDNEGKKFQHRYILIPGGVPARVAQPDWNDYNKVKAFYNLPD